MKVELLSHTPAPTDAIEFAARTCYDSRDKVSEGSAAKLVKGCVSKGHLSVTEHASASFLVSEVSRALMAQITRHRMLSFCIRSQRYVNEEEWRYVKPPAMTESQLIVYDTAMAATACSYRTLLQLGMKKEDARLVLPNACHTEMVVTANFRSWLEFCSKRQDRAAQWEIRELADNIYESLHEVCPAVFV